MYLFYVLFLVLSNSVGNQGDLMQGPGHSKTEEIPSYLVSVRNGSNCHICAGSMLSVNWVITFSPGCVKAAHIMPGLTKLTRCNADEENRYYDNIKNRLIPGTTSRFILYKVRKFDRNLKPLGLPKPSPPPRGKTGTVIGWSFENDEFVFKIIKDVVITEAVSSVSETFKAQFDKLSWGSPLIHGGLIYGFYIDDSTAFDNTYLHTEYIKEAIK